MGQIPEWLCGNSSADTRALFCYSQTRHRFGCGKRDRQSGRIVATVEPFIERRPSTQPHEDSAGGKDEEAGREWRDGERAPRVKAWPNNKLCLEESGIFEGEPDPEPERELVSTGTQTEASYTCRAGGRDLHLDLDLDLAAEIEKLNRLRESVEVGERRTKGLSVSVSPDQRLVREVRYYKERLEAVERKVQVYESSGEARARRLAERLGREVQLASQVKQLETRVNSLEEERARLEEERCELEEAENDTRLRCQRLEADIEAMSERARAADESRAAAKRRTKDARAQAAYWEAMVSKYEERNYELEERECELRHRLEVIERTTPAILLFNMWKAAHADVESGGPGAELRRRMMDRLKEAVAHRVQGAPAGPRDDERLRALEREKQRVVEEKASVETVVERLQEELRELRARYEAQTQAQAQAHAQAQAQAQAHHSQAQNHAQTSRSEASLESMRSADVRLLKELHDLTEKERELKKKIRELEQREAAYVETLQQADDIWAEMESSYKSRISAVEERERSLRRQLRRIETTSVDDDRDERIHELESTERGLRERVQRLEREVARLLNETRDVRGELEASVRSGDERVAEATAVTERERRRAKQLNDELVEARRAADEAAKAHERAVNQLKERLAKTRKELVHLDVTNSELREEVFTLECKIAEVEREVGERRDRDADMIRSLSRELRAKDDELAAARRLADEKALAAKREDVVGREIASVIAAREEPKPKVIDVAARLSCMLEKAEVSFYFLLSIYKIELFLFII